MDLSAITLEVGQALTNTGLTVATAIPDMAELPAILINPPVEVRYIATHGGKCEIDFTATAYVSAVDLYTAWTLLYRLLSLGVTDATSIPDALLAHKTPTSYRSIQVTRAGNIRPHGDNGIAANVSFTIFT